MLMPYRCVNCQAIAYSFGMTCPRCGKNGTMRKTGYEEIPQKVSHMRCPKCSSKKYNSKLKKCPACKYEWKEDNGN